MSAENRVQALLGVWMGMARDVDVELVQRLQREARDNAQAWEAMCDRHDDPFAPVKMEEMVQQGSRVVPVVKEVPLHVLRIAAHNSRVMFHHYDALLAAHRIAVEYRPQVLP